MEISSISKLLSMKNSQFSLSQQHWAWRGDESPLQIIAQRARSLHACPRRSHGLPNSGKDFYVSLCLCFQACKLVSGGAR